MKYYDLDKEEKSILMDYEDGELISVDGSAKARKYYKLLAQNSLSKTRNTNIRLTERVLAKLKQKAVEEGIPYQTLVSSVLHKFANRQVI